jgi:hypothetical protein
MPIHRRPYKFETRYSDVNRDAEPSESYRVGIKVTIDIEAVVQDWLADELNSDAEDAGYSDWQEWSEDEEDGAKAYGAIRKLRSFLTDRVMGVVESYLDKASRDMKFTNIETAGASSIATDVAQFQFEAYFDYSGREFMPDVKAIKDAFPAEDGVKYTVFNLEPDR